jgi:hypothetical protein
MNAKGGSQAAPQLHRGRDRGTPSGGFPHLSADDLRLVADVGKEALLCHLGYVWDGEHLDRAWTPEHETIIWLARLGLLTVALLGGGGEQPIDGHRTRLVSAVLAAFDHEDVLLQLTDRGREAIA